MDLKTIDKTISDISGEMDFYSLLTPVNQEEERSRFFDLLKEGREYNPLFKYKKKDLKGYKDELVHISGELDAGSDLENIFKKKIGFTLKQIDLLESSDSSFGEKAVSLHGTPSNECIEEALKILAESKDTGYSFPEETVSPEEMASIISSEMEKKDLDWKCTISSKIVPKVTVSGKERTIYINSRINYTQDEVDRLKVHEVRVHIFRGANGHLQPYRIFAEGLAGYNETEEGLAIVAEEKTGVLERDTRQMKLYSGRALAAKICLEESFYDSFKKLCEFFPEYMAYRLAERAKRGLEDTSNKGCMTKGFHYISGWLEVKKFLSNGGKLDILYTGKIGVKDSGCVKKLLEEGVLKKAEYLPDFL